MKYDEGKPNSSLVENYHKLMDLILNLIRQASLQLKVNVHYVLVDQLMMYHLI